MIIFRTPNPQRQRRTFYILQQDGHALLLQNGFILLQQ